ncbi:hypothetical protein MHU86_9672 [Fragilaria crotonensis]|nr:hypothetical protein MHU86_9672 [Fragilaria crotonensis]
MTTGRINQVAIFTYRTRIVSHHTFFRFVLRPQAETQAEAGKVTHKLVLQMEVTQMLSIQRRCMLPKEEEIHEPIPKRKPIRSNVLAANGPAEANLNVPRKFQPRKVIHHRFRACQPPTGKKTNTNMNQNHFRGNKHPLSAVETTITQRNATNWIISTFSSFLHPNCAPASHRRPSTAQINQRIPLRNAEQQTNIPPSNERTTTKLASLTSAKRSVVTSDATGTHSSPVIVRDSLGTNELLRTS